MTLIRRVLTLSVLLVAIAAPSLAQVTTGTPPFGSFGGGPDTINLANLNVQIPVPVYNKAGRGLPFSSSISYDSSVWYPVTSGSTTTWAPVITWGWIQQTASQTGYLYSTTTTSQQLCFPIHNPPLYKYVTTTSNFRYYDSSGTAHQFLGSLVTSTGSCSNSNTSSFTATALDGSGFQLNASLGTSTVVTPSGTVITPPYLGLTGAASEIDANGNEITINGSGVFTDTLGTTALTIAGSGTPASPLTYTYTAASGSNEAYTVKYTSYTIKTNYGCSGISEYGPTSQNLPSEIDLPDGTKYTFAYEGTPGYSGDYTGRLASVTLPTGGTISYVYSGGSNGITCADGTTATLTRTTPDGTWTYAHTESGSTWATTATDPQSNQSILNFIGVYETEQQLYKGSSSSGTLLDTVYTCYNGASYPCNSSSLTLPITQATVTNSWASGQTSQTVASYNSYGLPTEVDEYGYGSGSPGSLIRKTLTSYASLGTNIIDRPSSVSVYAAGASQPTSQTSYSYDQGSVTSTSGTPQHVSVSGSRGNPTTTTQLVSGSTTISATTTYYDTGTANTWTDSNNNTTTYGYGTSSCGNSFATSIAMPLSLSRSQTWNCNGALIASRTDENGKILSYSYDLMNRPAQANSPDGGWTLIAYTGGNQQDTYTGLTDTTASTSCSSCRHDQVNFDSLGRGSTRILVNDPEGQTTTAKAYDSLGRIHTTSNPYRSTSDPTYGLGTMAYDALNRVTTITHQDSNVIASYYGGDVGTNGGASTQLCSSSTYGLGYPTLTVDEAGMKRQSWTDALGRTIEADEPDSSNNMTLGTCHAYDVLGNVTQTVQGSQTRSYTYDGISRKTSETLPETGTTSFYYTTSGGGLCSGNPKTGCRRSDARGITITYSYDALNRLTSKTYSDSTPAAYFYYDESNVTVSGTAYPLTNTKGRVSHTSGAGGNAITVHSYDPMGRTQDFWQCTPFNCSSTSIWNSHYTYDLAGDLSSWQHPNGETITQTISNASRITQITSSLNDSTHPGTLAQNIHYAPQGAVSSLQNGCVGTGCAQEQETYDYNNRLQPVRIQLGTSSSPNANTCTVHNYYSGAANPTSCAIPNQASSGNDGGEMGHYFQDTTNPSLGHTATYTYDNMNRLTSSVATGSATHNLTFSYDRYANMTCVTNQQTSGPCPNWTFNTSTNQLTTTGFTYDAAGNLTTDVAGPHTYQWDAENRLKSIDNGSTATYTYNALGQRVEKLVGSTYTEYGYQEWGEELGEHNRSNWTVRLIPFGGRHLVHYNNSGGTNATYFMHNTKIGTTSQVTDYTGAVAQDQLYYPWGGEWSVVGTAQEKRFARLGHRDETETGLDPTEFRMFSSTQGRWLSKDPLTGCVKDPQALNRYAYSRNSPLTLTDPDGLQWGLWDPTYGTPFPAVPLGLGSWGSIYGAFGGWQGGPPPPPPIGGSFPCPPNNEGGCISNPPAPEPPPPPATPNCGNFSIRPNGEITAQNCNGRVANTQIFNADIPDGCTVDPDKSEASAEGVGITIDQEHSHFTIVSFFAPSVTMAYFAGPRDSKGNAGSYTVTMTLYFAETHGPSTVSATGDVGCPSQRPNPRPF